MHKQEIKIIHVVSIWCLTSLLVRSWYACLFRCFKRDPSLDSIYRSYDTGIRTEKIDRGCIASVSSIFFFHGILGKQKPGRQHITGKQFVFIFGNFNTEKLIVVACRSDEIMALRAPVNCHTTISLFDMHPCFFESREVSHAPVLGMIWSDWHVRGEIYGGHDGRFLKRFLKWCQTLKHFTER